MQQDAKEMHHDSSRFARFVTSDFHCLCAAIMTSPWPKSVILFLNEDQCYSDIFASTDISVEFCPPLLYRHLPSSSQQLANVSNDNIIISSSRAVESLSVFLRTSESDSESTSTSEKIKLWRSKQYYVVGERTSALLRAALSGLEESTESRESAKIVSEKSASALVSRLECQRIGCMTWLCGSRRLVTLSKVASEELVLYDVVDNPDLTSILSDLRSSLVHRYQYGVFFSPAGVDMLAGDKYSEILSMVCRWKLAIGAITSAMMKKVGWRVDGVAMEASPQGVLDMISAARPRYVIASRPSKLAIIQAEWVASVLSQHGVDSDLVAIDTRGDRNVSEPLSDIGGKGLFTEELQARLMSGDVDMVVHSLKDLETAPTPGLVLGAITSRLDKRDCVVLRSDWVDLGYTTLADLPRRSRVGTSSLRRSAQIKAYLPSLELKLDSIRGNVETRLMKLENRDHNYDAILLAVAGLERLGLRDVITHILGPSHFF